MSVYTEVFGGNTVYPSDVSYAQFDLTADTPTYWPLDANTGVPVLARIIDIVPSGAYAILMPDATLTGAGQTVLFNNLGPSTVTIKSFTGTTLASISAGTTWQLYLADNSTPSGTWRAFQFGATTAQAQAAMLAGYGLTATGSTLSQSAPTSTLATTYTVGASDRAKLFVWTSSLGTLNLPSVSVVGNGFFVSFSNQGSGNWTIDGDGSDTIDGALTKVLPPGTSVTLITDGLVWYSLGFGQATTSNFDYTSINLTGQTSPYTLSGAELNRVAYDFVGTLVANMVIVVPSTVQEYWVTNSTTGGSFTLSFRTASQTPAVTVPRGSSGIYYCTGSVFKDADTGGISTPIAITDGGTGATTAGAALTNLGGTSIGTGVFTATTTASAQTTLGATATGAALFTATNAAAARTTLGSTTVGDALFITASASAARTTLGATTVGSNVFTAATAGAARTAIGSTAVGDAVFIAASTSAAQTAIGATTVGTNVFTAASAAAARSALGSTTIGDAVFIAANAAAAQSALSLSPGTNVQAYSANLQAISGVTSAADKLFYFTGSGTGAVTDLTGVARTLVGQTTQALMRSAGLGSTTVGDALFTAANASAAQTTLALVPGTNVQTQNANLQAIANAGSSANKLFYYTGSGAGTTTDITSVARSFIGAATGSAAMATLFAPGTINNVVKSDGAGGYSVGPLPWTTFSTTSISTPVVSVDVTSIPSTYSEMIVEIRDVTNSAGAGVRYEIGISSNNLGTTYYRLVSGNLASASSSSGAVFLPNYAGPAGVIVSGTDQFAGTDGMGTSGYNIVSYRLAGGVNSIQFRVESGAYNLTAGTVVVKLR